MRHPLSTPPFSSIVGAGRGSGRFRVVAIPNLLSQIWDLQGEYGYRDPESAFADLGSAGQA